MEGAEMNGGSQSQTLWGQRFVIVSVSRSDAGRHGASVSLSLRGLEEVVLKKFTGVKVHSKLFQYD